jgi:hypothetical protein
MAIVVEKLATKNYYWAVKMSGATGWSITRFHFSMIVIGNEKGWKLKGLYAILAKRPKTGLFRSSLCFITRDRD